MTKTYSWSTDSQEMRRLSTLTYWMVRAVVLRPQGETTIDRLVISEQQLGNEPPPDLIGLHYISLRNLGLNLYLYRTLYPPVKKTLM
ncbi:MAG TPA: hypothetical protein VH593_13700, partial [Ktedonobacteraceae bacterium]